MCGFAGFIDLKKLSHQKMLEEMTDTLKHRGPDGTGLEWIDTTDFQIGLGHCRLAVLDLSIGGKQPMQFQQYQIIFNGELYNFKEIREELMGLGHTFISKSDTEVILHAYDEWGTKCLEKLIGMFAFVIYNAAKQELFGARDRAGIKPFFYYMEDGLFLFSSELKAFQKHSRFKGEIDLNAVSAFMQYGHVPTPHCIFKNTKKLKPGHFFIYRPVQAEKNYTQQNNRNERIDALQGTDTPALQIYSYWNIYDYYNLPKTDLPLEEAKIKTEEILKSAFHDQMIADVPVGIFLSGGYDSTCITALLQADRSQKLSTFTIRVPDTGLNEAPYAKKTAKHLGTDHHEFTCGQKEAMELIHDISYYYDEPFADSSAIPTMLISKRARQHVTVALSADGGDELFAGYNRYQLSRYLGMVNHTPEYLRKGIVGIMNRIPLARISIGNNTHKIYTRYEKIKNILSSSNNILSSPMSIMLLLGQQFTSEQVEKLFLFTPKQLENAYSSHELKTEQYSILSYMMAIDYQTYLLDDILQKVDRATMAVGLEGRVPFLDHRVVEWTAGLPDHFKYHNGSKKYILKEIVHRYVPKSLMDRPKMGFAIPIADWLQTDLREYIEEYINETRIGQQGIFNWDHVHKLKTDFLKGRKELSQKIWYILVFQMWYARWNLDKTRKN